MIYQVYDVRDDREQTVTMHGIATTLDRAMGVANLSRIESRELWNGEWFKDRFGAEVYARDYEGPFGTGTYIITEEVTRRDDNARDVE